ncbi:MBL fold metallo-hydrolase [Ktedonosporobacter rubrisoli]|uniref:MBL fold metallo-hydrolase n=1 Tax=Ktedonosporobacter rubrisoli TaxID=2509675 RepID=A0A4P6JI62_KTERU|nr:MBL fold metallo-hydrolase [Ktedonosporobacter rubrisoli]QBD74738.1 MBL fold metallo-hydrolase [Ktedonosporobacter rubrisoli]
MKSRNWLIYGGLGLGALGLGMLLKDMLPQSFDLIASSKEFSPEALAPRKELPEIDIEFLRCGSVSIPEFLAIRGSFALTPRKIAYSAVLIRHPKATFLYDTGLCAGVKQFLADQPFFFRQTFARFNFERSLADNLRERSLVPQKLDFALLSHLHWDHVSGIPDIPQVPLRVNQVEYAAAKGRNELVWRFMGKNPVELFACDGPPYEGFRSSHDLFGDGSIVLVPLPGHTIGNTGMFINRANGSRLFLLGDAVWVSENYLYPATMHHFFWSRITDDDKLARQTLVQLHQFARVHPDMPMVGMHDAAAQEDFI